MNAFSRNEEVDLRVRPQTRVIAAIGTIVLVGISATLVTRGAGILKALGVVSIVVSLPLALAVLLKMLDRRPLYVVKANGIWRRGRSGGVEITWSMVSAVRIVVSSGQTFVQLACAWNRFPC